jgi:hypothetical protein
MSEPQKQLILHDDSGQPWAISVRPDGQLQTAKWPDGEPVTMKQYEDREFLRVFPRVFAQEMNRLMPGLYSPERLRELGIESEDATGHE